MSRRYLGEHMGYWEQVAEDNLKARAQRANHSRARRIVGYVGLGVAGVLAWAVVLAPLWIPLVRSH